MFSNLALSLAAPLVAVTFGWNPIESADDRPDAGYEYQLRVTEADLEALRSGQIEELTSELPAEVGPITRLRVTLGADEPARVLSERDRRSPKQIARGAEPKRYEVAKPVLTEWNDAAAIKATQELSETAEQRTAFQNPLDPQVLADGFNRATQPLIEAGQDAGRRLEEEARRFANGTPQPNSGAIPSRSNAYGDRPQYGGAPNYNSGPLTSTAPPPSPAPTAAPANQWDPLPPAPTPATLRGPAQPAQFGQRQPPASVAPPRQANPAPPAGGIAAPFGTSAPLDAIPRDTQPRSAASPRLGAAAAPPLDPPAFAGWGQRTPDRSSFSLAQNTAPTDSFPSLGQPAPPVRSESQFARDRDRPAERRDSQRDTDAQLWGDDADEEPEPKAPAEEEPTTRRTIAGGGGDWDMDRLLLVLLTGITCFTLHAHIELRNKYRSALRGAPTGDTYRRSAA